MYDVELVESLPLLKRFLDGETMPGIVEDACHELDDRSFCWVYTSVDYKIYNAVVILGGKPEHDIEYIDIYQRERESVNLKGFDNLIKMKVPHFNEDILDHMLLQIKEEKEITKKVLRTKRKNFKYHDDVKYHVGELRVKDGSGKKKKRRGNFDEEEEEVIEEVIEEEKEEVEEIIPKMDFSFPEKKKDWKREITHKETNNEILMRKMEASKTLDKANVEVYGTKFYYRDPIIFPKWKHIMNGSYSRSESKIIETIGFHEYVRASRMSHVISNSNITNRSISKTFWQDYRYFPEVLYFDPEDLKYFVVCGGSVHSVLSRSLSGNQDIDIFFFGCTAGYIRKIIHRFIYNLKGNYRSLTINDNSITIMIDYAGTVTIIQFILRSYTSPAEIIMGFDTDMSCVLYDPLTREFYFTERYWYCIRHNLNTVNSERFSASYEYRLYKGYTREVDIFVPLLNRYLPEISLGNIKDEQGLSLLLNLLASQVFRDYYCVSKKLNTSLSSGSIFGKPYTEEPFEVKETNPSVQSIGTFHSIVLEKPEQWYLQSKDKVNVRSEPLKLNVIVTDVLAKELNRNIKEIIENLPDNIYISGKLARSIYTGDRERGIFKYAIIGVRNPKERSTIFLKWIAKLSLIYDDYLTPINHKNDSCSLQLAETNYDERLLDETFIVNISSRDKYTISFDKIRQQILHEEDKDILDNLCTIYKLKRDNVYPFIPEFHLLNRYFKTKEEFLDYITKHEDLYDYEKIIYGQGKVHYYEDFEDNIKDGTHTSTEEYPNEQMMHHRMPIKESKNFQKFLLSGTYLTTGYSSPREGIYSYGKVY